MCRVTLSRPIPVVALVSRYLTNKLIGLGPLRNQRTFANHSMRSGQIIRYYRHFRKVHDTEVSWTPLSLCSGYVIQVFLTRSPLNLPSVTRE